MIKDLWCVWWEQLDSWVSLWLIDCSLRTQFPLDVMQICNRLINRWNLSLTRQASLTEVWSVSLNIFIHWSSYIGVLLYLFLKANNAWLLQHSSCFLTKEDKETKTLNSTHMRFWLFLNPIFQFPKLCHTYTVNMLLYQHEKRLFGVLLFKIKQYGTKSYCN